MSSKKRGFTLVETMAALAILSILLLGVYTYIMTGNNVSNENFQTIKKATTIQGIENFLYAERNSNYFEENLLNKNIVIQGSNLLSLVNVLNRNMNGETRFFNNTNGKINYILALNTVEKEKNYYEVNIKLYTLKEGKAYTKRSNNPIEYAKKNGRLDNLSLLIQCINLQGGEQ
ncbi:MAG: prepilin-type N-terminal cleavage/methylation domain-containing protein [Clostridium sp.]|uniref:prepilin-type N-terminal cleavage/methylation domain-containing protein n=1 Tax=Clostridium sp. TaxID=1506 RepID=UPI003F3EC91D